MAIRCCCIIKTPNADRKSTGLEHKQPITYILTTLLSRASRTSRIMLTFASAVIFTLIKSGFLKFFSDVAKSFWNEWELRILVLCSLGLQFLLVYFGNRWKRRPSVWLSLLVWSSYCLADWIASLCLSTLFNRSGEFKAKSSDPTFALMAFWGPFFLLHLGGSDTITAYSLDDNDLWLRRLIALGLQVAIASYFCFMIYTSTTVLGYVAIPVLVAGIIKCAERTWILWGASGKQFRVSLFDKFPEPKPGDDHTQLPDERKEKNNETSEPYRGRRGFDSQVGSNVLREAKQLHEANILFNMFKLLIANIALKFKSNAYGSFIIYRKQYKYAFKLIEVELGFMYDMLYTKARIMQTIWATILRFISLLCSVSALVAFILVLGKDPFPKIKHTIDVKITYFLLVGAIVLDALGAMTHIFSNWTLIRLSENKDNTWNRSMYTFIAARVDGGIGKNRQMFLPQLNLIRYVLVSMKAKNRALKKCFDSYHEYIGNYIHTTFEPVDDKLKSWIYTHLQQKSLRYGFSSFDFEYLREILNERGLYTVSEEKQGDNRFIIETFDKEFDHTVLVWHIATDICYHDLCHQNQDGRTDNATDEKLRRQSSKALSDYMFYLMVAVPTMLPKGIRDLRIQHTRNEAVRYLEQIEHINKTEMSRVCENLVNLAEGRDPEETVFQIIDDRHKSVLFEGIFLAKRLEEIGKPWKLICNVWVEMLTYAATHCGWKQHAVQLGQGGELLTHVGLLMAHFGLSQQIRVVNPTQENSQFVLPKEYSSVRNDKDAWASFFLSCLA